MDYLGPAGTPERLHGFGQLVQHQRPLPLLGAEERGEVADGGLQVVPLVEQATGLQCGEPLQGHVEDVVGLEPAEVETIHEAVARRRRILRAADDGHHLVDDLQSHEEAGHQVESLLGPGQPVACAAHHHVEAVVDVVTAHLVDPECAGLAIDQDDVVYAERLLQRRQAVQLAQDGLGVVAGLDRHLEAEACVAIREVLEVRDARHPSRLVQLLELRDHTLGPHQVREFGDHDGLAAPADVLHVRPGPDAYGPAAGLVGLADAVVDHDAAAGEVGTGEHGQHLVDRGLRPSLVHRERDRGVDLGQVVGGHVGRHAHGNSGGAVEQEVG